MDAECFVLVLNPDGSVSAPCQSALPTIPATSTAPQNRQDATNAPAGLMLGPALILPAVAVLAAVAAHTKGSRRDRIR